jgi:hypothetical protein
MESVRLDAALDPWFEMAHEGVAPVVIQRQLGRPRHHHTAGLQLRK